MINLEILKLNIYVLLEETAHRQNTSILILISKYLTFQTVKTPTQLPNIFRNQYTLENNNMQ